MRDVYEKLGRALLSKPLSKGEGTALVQQALGQLAYSQEEAQYNAEMQYLILHLPLVLKGRGLTYARLWLEQKWPQWQESFTEGGGI